MLLLSVVAVATGVHTSHNDMLLIYDVVVSVVFATRAFFDLACVPSLNPFLNLLCTNFKCLIRPVPVVCLRMAFFPQLSTTCDVLYLE